MSDESKAGNEAEAATPSVTTEGVELSDEQLDSVSGGIGEVAQVKPSAGIALNPGKLKTWGDPHEFGG